jgi:hypothetical protein
MLGLRYIRGLRGLLRHLQLVGSGRQPIYLDHTVHPTPRYGWGRPPHGELRTLVAAGQDRCATLIRELGAFAEGLRAIPVERPRDRRAPHWENLHLAGLDAATLYAFPALFGSRRYLEIGSGCSTKFVRQSVIDNALGLRIVSIDPCPRAEIDELCDEVVREPLERAPLEMFFALERNDILMCDGSHRCLQNTDVTVLFLEVLPRLKPGVLIYVDDIYLPHDYPSEWEARYYSEQYLLAVLLQADAGRRYEVLFPGFYTSIDPDLSYLACRFWRQASGPKLAPMQSNGFWLRVRD